MLREMRVLITNRRVWALWLAATAIAIIAAPFKTGNLPMGARAAYWILVDGFCLLAAFAAIILIIRRPALRRIPGFARSLAGSALIAFASAAFIVALNAVFWPDAAGLPSYSAILSLTMPISLAIGAAASIFGQPETAALSVDPASLPANDRPVPEIAFVRRLPLHLGRKLISVSVKDHYCEAVTANGRTLVLMRFADALAELEHAGGLQIHRSHWIALNAVSGASRSGDSLSIRLTDGRALPVSRSRLAEVRAKLRL